MAREVEIASFLSVTYDKDTDDVYVTFKVHNEKYKDYALRWASREEGRLIFRGETLSVIEDGESDANI